MNNSTLGQAVPQVTARAKVLGRAKYVGDLSFSGMLHAKVLRSPYPSARIRSIDIADALALPGVRAVLTGRDAPDVKWGVFRKERHVLAKEIVRFAGEEIAAVLATSEDIATSALDLIRVDYEELTPILTADDALLDSAPRLHTGRPNIAHEIACHRGDVDTALAQADLVHEQVYTTHAQYPGYLEPNGVVALLDPDGRLIVHTPCHSVFLMRSHIAAALDIPASMVKVVQTTTGGAFGQKMLEDDTCLVAGLLALRTGSPVRLVNSRLEDFSACPTSLPERITLRIGMRKDGLIVAKDVHVLADSGAYCGLSHQVLHVTAMRSDNMHTNHNVRIQATLAYTNTPPHGAFRGFGGSQMQFALNSHIDTMAEKLGLDPIDVHKLNAIEAGTESLHGWKIGSNGIRECLDQCAEGIGWREKRGNPSTGHPDKRRGVGIAAAIHVSGNRTMGNWDGATVIVRVNEDGRVTVISGECDMGQGATTVLTQIVAHELDLPLNQVHVLTPDTDTAPHAIGAIGSRVTIVAGNAAMRAARNAREHAIAQSARMLGVDAADIQYKAGVATCAAKSAQLTLAQIATAHIWQENGATLQTSATWDPDTVMHSNLYGNVAPAYSFAAQAVVVEVDLKTGQVELIDSFVSDDCGKAINPLALHGQTNGATVQAMGWTLYEHLKLEDGRIANGNLADYTMPTADSVPLLKNGLVESMDPNGPYGAKGASETAIQPGAGAIANAVYDAVGVRITDLPISPAKVLAALRAARQEGTAHA